ncbi:hypothetical protein [Burkholderia ubonensis]|uniref:hypothetical protein n=1 Tax=Burkholderia ubonensis TaxID=101571 RepID=UPI000A4DC689|nr:hypothetical protein [Burkholderia ubonensis]
MTVDREEAKHDEPWHKSWRQATTDSRLDPDTDDIAALTPPPLLNAAAKPMADSRVPLPKSASHEEPADK